MLRNCPDPVDEQDIHFKLHCRLKVFDNKELRTFEPPHNLIACASRYGLLFIGSNSTNLQAIQLSSLENYSPKDKDISDYPHRTIELPSNPKHISVNCDSTVLAVVVEQDKCPVVIFHEVLSYYKQNVQTLMTLRLSANPGIFVTEINWNPAIPAFFTACKSDGSLGIYELKGISVEINEIPPAAEVSSFCWSPKGKQIAVGSKKGTITQYKPDLKAVRMVNAPPLSEPASLISLQWVSNYQFIGVYQLTSEAAQSKLIVVDAPKAGEVTYTNYEDICYSGFSQRPQFFMILQQHWNILLVASSNSAELAVLGFTPPDSWTQWIISDSSRAELPLSTDHQETLPIGLSLDISNTKPYPWDESTIAPCPYVLMLSHQGVLCVFDIINLKNVPPICTPPDPIEDLSGLNQFIVKPINLISAKTQEAKLESAPQLTFTETPKKPANELPTGPQLNFPVKTPTTLTSESNPIGFSFSTSQSTPIPAQSKNLFAFTPPSTLPGTQAKPLFGERQSQPSSLFGGQASLTPIKPSLVAQPQPSFDQISITPISKGQAVKAKGHVDDTYSSIFSALNAQSTATVPVQMKPIVISMSSNKTAAGKNHTPTNEVAMNSKPDASITSKPEVSVVEKSEGTLISKPKATLKSKPEVALTPKSTPDPLKFDTEAILQKMIKEDSLSLDAELRAIIQKGKMVNINLGTEADKIEMLNVIQNLSEFLEEISEISVGEHSEIHTLKQNLVLSWAWYEEALSRYNTSKDEMMRLLIKSQPLDSATEKRYSDIKKLIFYIESQLLQVNNALDEQWDKFQDYVKKTYRVQMPTMEAIYQAMVRQNAVLQKQGYIMKDISRQLKQKSRSSGGSLLLSVDNVHLEDELKQLQLNYPDNKSELCEKAFIQSKKLSAIKSKKLRLLLKKREVVHITTIKPYKLSETFQSPNTRLSLLEAKMSPVVPISLEPKQIDFSQSTPLRNFNLETVTSNSTQIQPIKPLNLGFANPSSSKTTNITPISKSAPFFFTPTTIPQQLSSNSPSAFVPTTQAAFAMKEKTSAFAIPSVTSQKPLTGIITDTKTNTSSQAMFTTATALETRKPVSSIPSFLPSAKSGLPMFPLTTTSGNNTPTSGSNFSVTSIKTLSDIPLFENTIPKTTTITVSSVQSIGKTSKFFSTTSSFLTVATTTVTPTTKSFPGFSLPIQSSTHLPISNVSTKTTAPIVSNQNSSITTTTCSTSSFSSKGTAINTLSTFGTISTPVTSTSLFASQPASASSSFSFANFNTSSTGSITSDVSSTTTTVSSVNSKTSTVDTSIFKSTITTESSPNLIVPVVTSTSPKVTSSVATSSVPPISFSSVMVTNSSIFGSTGTSTFVPTNTTNSSTFASSVSPSIFGGSTATSSSTKAPLFGSKSATTGSIFGAPSSSSLTSTAPLFETNTSVPSSSSLFETIFGSANTPAFGAHSTIPSSSTPFDSNVSIIDTSSKIPSPSVFGPITSASVFGVDSTVSSPTSIFGNVSKVDSTTKSSSPSIFGSTITPQTSQTSLFGQPSSISTKSIFGNTPTTTQTSIFGSTNTPVTQVSLFGGSTSQGSFFATSPATTAATQPSIFGSVATSVAKPVFASSTSSSSIFPSTTIASTSSFGQSATNTFGSSFGGTSNGFNSPLATSAPGFGQQPTTFGANTGTIFGGAQTTTTGSIFGTNTSGSSTFGAANSSGTIFGSPAVSSSFSFASPTGTSAENALNFGVLNVGSTTTTSGNIFGGGSTFGSPATVSNPFGKSLEKSSFGGASNLFGTPTTAAAPFGSNAAFGSNNQSTFGSTTFGSPAFGQQEQQQAFGQSTFAASTFGSTQPGPFSSGAGVGQSGFGSSPSFQKPAAGFGSAPVFGSSPTLAFGGSPSFGGAPAFGAAPSFGSPTKVFGSNTASAAFGSSATGSPGFGNLANQNTVGFGNLAKQSANSPTASFGGNSSFSSWR